MFTLDVQGLDLLVQHVARLGVEAQRQLVEAIQHEAEDILQRSMPLVPVDTGLLVSTGMVEPTQDGADIRYGGHGLAPYATLQHEDTSYNHPNGGQSHYLSQPLFEATATLPQQLAQRLAATWRS